MVNFHQNCISFNVCAHYSDCVTPVADGTAPEDPIFGTEAPLSDNHVTDPVQEDADPPMETNDVDPMEEDLLNEIYEKAADVSVFPLL